MKLSDIKKMKPMGKKTLNENYADPGREVEEYHDEKNSKAYQVDEKRNQFREADDGGIYPIEDEGWQELERE